MDILRFYKEGKRWYADIPSWTGKKSSLEMVFGANKLLDIIDKGKGEVYLHISIDPIQGGETLYFRKKMWINGATYEMRDTKTNKRMLKLWLCDVTLHVMGKFPKKIYYKEILDYYETRL